jgi:hypothetical protein
MSQGQQNPNFPITNASKATLMFTGDQGASDEGSYFVVTNPTPGTAIATTTSVVDDATGATTHAQQKPVMYLQNQWPTGTVQAQSVYLRYLKMFIVQVPTSATVWRYAIRLSPNVNKMSSAGTVCTPVNPNGGSGQLSKLGVWFGAIPVANDEWLFTFGQAASSFDSIGTQTLVKRLTIPVPPIIIPPQWGMTLEMWGASNAAAPSWEFEMGYIERPAGQ